MKKVFFLLSILICTKAIAQSDSTSNTKEVRIIHADKLQFYTDAQGNAIRKMVGNVQLQQDSTFMYCDSAFLKKEQNTVDMFGHVRITDGQNITAISEKLNYDGNAKMAKLIGKAKLTDSEMEIKSETLYYDRASSVGYYLNGGVLTTGATVLSSKKAYYHTNTSEAFFNQKVHIDDPEYSLDSDTLMFNTQTKVSTFYGNTSIYNTESTILCNNGTYDTQKQIATFGYGTTILNEPQILKADSLYYEKQNGYGKAMKAFDWYDKEMKVSMKGTDAEYFEKESKIIAINRPMLESEIDEDTLFLRGDTVIAINDFTKRFQAFPNVRVFKSDLQAAADSLYYSQNDSMMRLYENPILWNEESEMKGDTVMVQIANSKVENIFFLDKAFILTQSQGKLFDQVKGKKITGYFADSKLDKMLVERNAESLYFGKNDDGAFIGGNQSKSVNMWIYVVESKIKKIVFLDKPEAVFTPITKMTEAMFYLKDFKANFELRPISKDDL